MVSPSKTNLSHNNDVFSYKLPAHVRGQWKDKQSFSFGCKTTSKNWGMREHVKADLILIRETALVVPSRQTSPDQARLCTLLADLKADM